MSESRATSLRLHPLAFHEDRDEVIVGRPDIDSYVVLPPDGAALLRQLVAGREAADAAAWYWRTYDEHVDMEEFLHTLRALDFVREDSDLAVAHSPVRWRKAARAVFSPPAWAVYAALVVTAVALCVAHPDLRPRPSHVIFTRHLMLIVVVVSLGQLVFAGVHEMFHVLAGRRVGVRSTVHLSRRFYFVVFETNLDGLVVLPRPERVLPILAGLLADVLILSGLTIVGYLARPQFPTLSGACLALAFTCLPRMAWQFYVFLRTDIYFLLTTLTGASDLDIAARARIFNLVQRVRRRPGRRELSVFSARDVRSSLWFAPLLVGGYAVMTGMLILTLPVLWRLLKRSCQQVLHGDPLTGQFWDGAVFAALFVAQVSWTAALTVKNHHRLTPGDRP